MSKRTRIDIIADNGGGITLQYHGRVKYAHTYNNGAQVIEDLIAVVDGFGAENWDGNEYPEIGFDEYDQDTESNGGYRWYTGTADQLIKEFADIDPDDAWGYNVKDLAVNARYQLTV